MVDGWKQIASDVHREGGVFFMQIWAPGRAGFLGLGGGGLPKSEYNVEGGEFEYVSSSAIPLTGTPSAGGIHPTPRPLTTLEIGEYVRSFGEAAYNAVHRAGLDGVEVHAGQGYLLDQFLQDTCNKREDEYGGSIEGRCRFPLEAVAEAVNRVGQERVGVRITPWGKFQGKPLVSRFWLRILTAFLDMGMADPIPTYTYFITELKTRYPSLAYLHVTEPRVSGAVDRTELTSENPTDFAHESNDLFRELWASGEGAERRVYISAGGYTPEEAKKTVDRAEREGRNECVAFGRLFIANVSCIPPHFRRFVCADILRQWPKPDLPLRIKRDIPLARYNRPTFYLAGSPEGYIDYPFAEDAEVQASVNSIQDETAIAKTSSIPDSDPAVCTESLCVG